MVGVGDGIWPEATDISENKNNNPGNTRPGRSDTNFSKINNIKILLGHYSTPGSDAAAFGLLKEANIFFTPLDKLRQTVVSLASSKSE